VNRDKFEAANWYNAVPLTERLSSIKCDDKQLTNTENDQDLAQRILEQWRNQKSLTINDFFAQRLAMDGISETELLSLLAEPIEAVKERFPETPPWLVQIAQAFAASTTANSQPLQLPPKIQSYETHLFLYWIEPLINQGLTALSEGIQALSQEYPELPFEPNVVTEMLLANLAERLLPKISRTLVLELNVARLQGWLTGDTPQERFHSFGQRLRQPDVALSLLKEYPVLARQITTSINHWLTFSLEFLQHLCADWQNIRSVFSPKNDPGLFVELKGDAGDTHRRGRSVAIAKFSSGFQLVYKPRSLAVDVHFQYLLTWLNQRGNHPSFRTLKVLDRGDYGWSEFVTPQSCTTPRQIQRFYERQGGYLALLYTLQATDFHCENIIAAGEHPVLVDLESLFHPPMEEADLSEAELLASKTMEYSVLSIGLLPNRAWGNDPFDGIDLSGLGAKEGQLTPYQLPYWQGVGTDEMQLQCKQMEMPTDHNQPSLNDNPVNLLDYVDAIATGFTTVYQLLLQYRNELLSPEGPIAAFANDEMRVILRATRIYSLLLAESFHPDMLRDALERDQFFDRLWFQVQYQPWLKHAIAAERDDLLAGDIPLFTTRPNSQDLWSSSNQRIRDFFSEPSLNRVYHRLQQLSDLDMTQQLWFVRASLATLDIELNQSQVSSYPITEPQTIANQEQLLTAARTIGDRLHQLALKGEKDVSWIGLTHLDQGKWALVPLGVNLYDDLAGIVLFLAYLGAVTEAEHYTTLAQAALSTLRRQVEKRQSYIKSIGGFDGWGGIIYTLTHLAVLWNQPTLLTEAEKIVPRLPNLIQEDKQFDIISGAAGCIASLLSLYRYQPSDSTLAVAIQCGDHLIAQAQPMKQGIGWDSGMPKVEPLTGFSHGAAGIAWALLELASVTGESRFETTARAAMEYERSHFLPDVGNWPDLRNFADTLLADKPDMPTCLNAWCHGAPGIGLARLRSLMYLDDARIRSEINTALKTTLAQGFGGNHSLCHGDLGNLELLLQASLILDDPHWNTQVDRFAGIILESIQKHGWLCGVPLGVETPGLMTGLAGIGYGLLRLAAPERIPSVLVLEPPKVENTVPKLAALAFTA
jgi:type 2 lantibiotic biosynthesis protein LanM